MEWELRDLYIHDKYMLYTRHKQFWEGFMRIVVTSGGSAWGLSCVRGRLIHFSLHALFFFSVHILFF